MTAAVMDDRLFVDGVMARVANEPLPTPARALRTAVATLDRRLASGAVWTAWHLSTAPSMVVRRGLRLRSAALLAALLLMLAIGTTVAAAGAAVVVKTITDRHTPIGGVSTNGDQGSGTDGGIRVLPAAAPTATPWFPPVGGDGNQRTPAPDGDSQPSPSPDVDNSADDNPGNDNSGDGGPTASPGDGDNAGAGSDNSGSGGGDEDSPEPSAAPEATDAPQATDAPEPTQGPDATDAPDDGGSGGGDGSVGLDSGSGGTGGD